MKDQESLPLGIVLERRRIDHPWKDFDWRPVTVIPGAPACDPEGEWRVLHESEDRIHYHSGTLTLELFRRGIGRRTDELPGLGQRLIA